MVLKPTFGKKISGECLNSLDNYLIITIKEPWSLIELNLHNEPHHLIINEDMTLTHLECLAKDVYRKYKDDIRAIVGLGGGSACDTAKYISWRLNQEGVNQFELILVPSIISVDAFLCSSIAVRDKNGRVVYVGESNPSQILIDFELIKKAPPYLNIAGVSDTISIASALGDWKLARDENDALFDQVIFNKSKKIALNLIKMRDEIRDLSETGIKALVDGFYEEVLLCEQWGNARPEEGSEHFLAYCLESITHDHYIHGNLIGMNVLISLYLQEDYAEFSEQVISQFFDQIRLRYKPEQQSIALNDLHLALKSVQDYVKQENLPYSIYNSPRLKLNAKKRDEIINIIKEF